MAVLNVGARVLTHPGFRFRSYRRDVRHSLQARLLQIDMSPPQDFERRLEHAWPAARWQDVSVVVAVSGGADSVALLRALARLKRSGAGRLWVAHFNHALRGPESQADEALVCQLAERLGLGCHVGRAPAGVLCQPGADGLEAAARGARYQFLEQTANQVGARYVATAHTADDQVETVLQRVFRGTGIAGLAGMRRARPLGPAVTLIRPLLDFGRSEVREYLAGLGQAWREDASNACTDATRNWLRHELLPSIERQINPSAPAAILRLARLAAEAQAVAERLAGELAERAIEARPGGPLVCHCDQLAAAERTVVREMFVAAWRAAGWPEQAMGFAEWDALAELALQSAAAGASVRDFPGAIRAKKRRSAYARPPLKIEFACRGRQASIGAWTPPV